MYLRQHRAALAASAAAFALLLSACAGGTASQSGSANSAPSDPVDSAASSLDASTSSADSSTSAASTSSDSAPSVSTNAQSSDSASSASTAGSIPGGEIPEGWKKVTAKTSGISLAVPEDWQGVGQDIDEETAKSTIEQATQGNEQQAQALSAQRPTNDIAYFTAGQGEGTLELILVGQQAIPEAALTSPDTLKQGIQSRGQLTVHNVEEIQTPTGKGFLADIESNGVKGKDLYISNGKGNYYEVAILAFEEETLNERYEKVLKSISVE
ncbi:MAG: hypothetical protein Q4C87_01245 [Actinomycetaceae bacterium]|nr:hypothetical protein [Actinomycetaceae bacterium]